MKHLPKHLRPRWRYLAVELETWSTDTLDKPAFQRAVWYAAGNLLGDPGSAAADLSVIEFRFKAGSGEAIVRARRGEVEAARACLACIDAVDDAPLGVRLKGVSGTIRACEERYLGGASGPLNENEVVFDGDRYRGWVRDDRVDVETPSGKIGATDADVTRPGAEAPSGQADTNTDS